MKKKKMRDHKTRQVVVRIECSSMFTLDGDFSYDTESKNAIDVCVVCAEVNVRNKKGKSHLSMNNNQFLF